jgi:hypothetical protein
MTFKEILYFLSISNVASFYRHIYNYKVKGDEMGKARSTYQDRLNAYRIFMGKQERKRPLGRFRRKWG